jgi:hypothetical protein
MKKIFLLFIIIFFVSGCNYKDSLKEYSVYYKIEIIFSQGNSKTFENTEILFLRNPESVRIVYSKKNMFDDALFLSYRGENFLPIRKEIASHVLKYEIKSLKIKSLGESH